MTAAEKALIACIEYAGAKAEIRLMTLEIGNNLAACLAEHKKKNPDVGGFESHLAQAYAFEVDEDYYGDSSRRYLSEEEQEEVLSECPYCMAAHKAVQSRKAARKRLGISKRKISAIGRRAASTEVEW